MIGIINVIVITGKYTDMKLNIVMKSSGDILDTGFVGMVL